MLIRRLKLLFGCFALIAVLGAPTQANDKIPLKTALFDGCPFICEDGSGIFLDILRLALKDTPYRLQLVHLPFERAKQMLEKGKIDLLPGILENGVQPALFPETWLYYTQVCFYVRRGDDWTYNGPSSLDKRHLAVERGIIHTPEIFEYLKTHPDVTRIGGTKPLTRQLKMLNAKRVDTISAERTVLNHELQTTGQYKNEFKRAGCFEPDYEFVAISAKRPDAQTLKKILSHQLMAIRSSAAFEKLAN